VLSGQKANHILKSLCLKPQTLKTGRKTYCSFWHAADTPPLEGLLILRCAIHDPLEGLQIWKMKVAKMRVQELNLGVGCLKVPARCVT
jgi:hypothetical protein